MSHGTTFNTFNLNPVKLEFYRRKITDDIATSASEDEEGDIPNRNALDHFDDIREEE